MSNVSPVTVVHGDGIGPEIMDASPHVIQEAGARIKIETIEIGEKVYLRGKAAHYSAAPHKKHSDVVQAPAKMTIDGIDVYIAWPGLDTPKLASAAQKANGDGLELSMIDNHGVKVWPDGMSETLLTDAYLCRFTSTNGTSSEQNIALLGRVLEQGLEIVKTETLRSYNASAGYTLAQGQ